MPVFAETEAIHKSITEYESSIGTLNQYKQMTDDYWDEREDSQRSGIPQRYMLANHVKVKGILDKNGCTNDWTPDFTLNSTDTEIDYDRFAKSIDACLTLLNREADEARRLHRTSRWADRALVLVLTALLVFVVLMAMRIPVVQGLAQNTQVAYLRRSLGEKLFDNVFAWAFGWLTSYLSVYGANKLRTRKRLPVLLGPEQR